MDTEHCRVCGSAVDPRTVTIHVQGEPAAVGALCRKHREPAAVLMGWLATHPDGPDAEPEPEPETSERSRRPSPGSQLIPEVIAAQPRGRDSR